MLADWRTPSIKQRYLSQLGFIRTKIFIYIVKLRLKFTSLIVLKNGFPYTLLLNLLSNAEHLVLFYRGTKPILELVGSDLTLTQPKKTIVIKNVSDFLAWENPKKLKSIKNLHHLQLIIEKV